VGWRGGLAAAAGAGGYSDGVFAVSEGPAGGGSGDGIGTAEWFDFAEGRIRQDGVSCFSRGAGMGCIVFARRVQGENAGAVGAGKRMERKELGGGTICGAGGAVGVAGAVRGVDGKRRGGGAVLRARAEVGGEVVAGAAGGGYGAVGGVGGKR